MNNKILMLVNIFPPSGESGIQRPVKFIKYLALAGWDTIVITPKRPVNKKASDLSLINEIPSSTKIIWTASLGLKEENLPDIRSEFTESRKTIRKVIWHIIKPVNDLLFPIDKQIGWVPFALLKAIQVIKRQKIRNIYITAYPFSAYLCGVILKKLFKDEIFWIADYRDAWQFAPLLQKNVLPFRYKFICKMDERFLRSTDCAIFTSDYVLSWYVKKYPWLENKSACITNGYDEDDFTNIIPVRYDQFTLVYMGKIHALKGNPIPLLETIDEMEKRDIQYIHIGTIGQAMLNKIKEKNFVFFHYLGYKPHFEALAYSAGADINVIILNNDPDSVGVIPGKLFELLRLGKPILAVGPENSIVRDIILNTNSGVYACSDDKDQIVKALEMLLNNKNVQTINYNNINKYSRETCTDQLISIYMRQNE